MDIPPIYGLLAEFDGPEELLAAARSVREAGYEQVNAYSPFPIDGLAEAVGVAKTRLPWIVLGGGLIGGMSGYALQYYGAVMSYPINVGGRPLHSWPAFIPITFELTILCAALSAVLGMLALNGLPMPYHPLFNAPRFALASRDRFFVCIRAEDPKFNLEETKSFLQAMSVHDVAEVRQ